MALADHHAVCSVQSNVLDVGTSVVFNTNVLGQRSVRESRGGTTVTVGGQVGGLWLFNRGHAVMQVLHTALANVAVGIFSGADCVNSVDEPFSTGGHLQKKYKFEFCVLIYVCVCAIHESTVF